jgi:hypothetical protein
MGDLFLAFYFAGAGFALGGGLLFEIAEPI